MLFKSLHNNQIEDQMLKLIVVIVFNNINISNTSGRNNEIIKINYII
jgi:hypothetical protein